MIKRDKKSEWVIALNKLISTDIEEVPEGWKTREHIARDMGVSPNQASKGITRLKRAKMIDVQKFKIRSSGKHGIVKRIDHYRLVKKSNASATKTSPKAIASSKSSPSRKHIQS